MESSRWDKFRILTIALIFSGALNVGLVMALIFSSLEESADLPSAKLGIQDCPAPANGQLLSEFAKLSFSELLVCLTNREPVEDGYTKRDLALSALTSCQHFNLDKALSGAPIQRRTVCLGSGQTVELYPGLTNEQYEAIIRYAYQEKWPLTSQGLFTMLHKWPKNGRDQSLALAFFATPEFYTLQALFQKTGAPQDPHLLLDLCLEASWDVLDRFMKEQSQVLDLSLDKRRSLLLTYLSLQCPTAAQIMLASDFQFAKTRLVDGGVLLLLNLLQEKTALAERFCLDLLHSPRADAVWKAAAEKLYAFSGEIAPLPFDHKAALFRFALSQSEPAGAPSLPASQNLPKSSMLPPSRLREHTVQEGETLWKIARQYKVKVDDLVQLNALEKDRLLPGMVLRVPQGAFQGTGSEPPR